MATQRDRPYSQFNFLVKIGQNDENSIEAGFQEVSGLGVEATITEYRNGNESINAPRKINATYKVPDVTLKRGVIGATDLYEWMRTVQRGKQEESLEDVVIQLQSEDREDVALSWTLKRARPMKYTGPSLNGKGTDIAIDELVLSCEDIEIE